MISSKMILPYQLKALLLISFCAPVSAQTLLQITSPSSPAGIPVYQEGQTYTITLWADPSVSNVFVTPQSPLPPAQPTYLVNPPDQRSNTQRIFVPRTALESLTVLAVIGATRRPRRGPTDDQRQVTLFEE
jgi:hypothetical protein